MTKSREGSIPNKYVLYANVCQALVLVQYFWESRERNECVMKVEDLIIELIEVIDDAKTLPLSGGKSVIDAEHIKEILDDIEETLPQEVRQAKAIVADRAQIIADAKKEGENIVRSAEERKKTLVNQNEIVRQAQQEASEIISDAKLKAKEIRKAANEYVEELMRKTDELMTAQANEIKKTRQSLKASQRTGN